MWKYFCEHGVIHVFVCHDRLTPSINTINEKGPTHDPCGMLSFMVSEDDRKFPIYTGCCRFIRNNATHLINWIRNAKLNKFVNYNSVVIGEHGQMLLRNLQIELSQTEIDHKVMTHLLVCICGSAIKSAGWWKLNYITLPAAFNSTDVKLFFQSALWCTC